MTEQKNESYVKAQKPPERKPMNKISGASNKIRPIEPDQEPETAPEPPRYQDTIPEFPGLRVPEGKGFKEQHRQRGVYIEHELDAILRQQQAMIGKGTVTKIVNAALRDYFKKHRITYIDHTQRTD